ncbi:MAG: outer membrane protein assembly factor BamC [Gammaproteobacteria bacterium]
MRNQAILLCFYAALVSCADTDPRYKDTTMLERPPHMQAIHPAEERKTGEDSANAEPKVMTGLGDNVSMTPHAKPPAIRLKQAFDEAWVTLGRALKQLELEISDRNREEKVYYVKYDPDDFRPEDAGILSAIGSSFKNDFAEETYILRVEPENSDTAITAELGDKADPEVGVDGKESEPRARSDGSLNLLKTVYKMLHDDLKPE